MESKKFRSFRLPYLAIWINNLSNILFDERKSPYHLLLSAFYRTGAHNAFFNIISNYFGANQDQIYCGIYGFFLLFLFSDIVFKLSQSICNV